MTYDVQADETLEEIAADALRAWSWQVSFHEPTAEEVSEMVLRIVDTNKLTSATQIADGDRLSLPEPDDVAVPQLTPLQRAIHNALSPAPSAGPSSSIAGPSGLVRGGPVRLAEHAVWKDTNERITAISYAGGSIREFRYDSAGQLVEITQPDGQIYTRLDADVWAVKQTYSAADAQAEKVHLSIDSAGTYVCRQLDGTRTFTHTASGYRTLESTDGWKVSRNANNLVDRIAYADGTSCTFEYGPQSQPLSYKDRSDRTWQSSEDGTAWTRYSPEGKVIERQARTTMFINADGEILREDMRREITTMERPDGTKNIEYKNLARVELDTRGKALRYRTRGNRIYSISASGVLLYETKEGDLLPALAMDALMYVHRENREFKPTASDLDRQCELIMQASSLNEGAKLQAGTTLIIPVA
jgi:YD repeat-containing protein